MGDRESSTATPARRRDDLVDSEAMLGMVRFLMTRPTCEQICQQLVLDVLARHEPRQAAISLFGIDGSLHIVGEFGLSAEQVAVTSSVSLWDADPMADAVRTGEVVTVEAAALGERYPHLAAGVASPVSLVACPLTLPNQRVGVLRIGVTALPDPAPLQADLGGVMAVLALYLSMLMSIATTPDRAIEILGAQDAARGFPTGEFAVLQRPASPAKQPPTSLSDRQSQILALMALGMTNSQIAKRIGYSESTVRQESMVVYRFFGVGGRQEAVRVAESRGMLTGPTSA